mmetsp:Transcript_6579/g.5872  ORF Transcript_6579/g.5872 Transcript_6579/m.5872 type:complete len:122 (+) Transcript_6579:621-986(+)
MTHGASHGDIKECIDYIKTVRPNSKLVGFGLSLGAGLLSNYMAMEKEHCSLVAGVGVSCLFDLHLAMDHMVKHFFGAYDYILGFFVRMHTYTPVQEINKMNMKCHPERVPGPEMKTTYSLS